MTPNAKTILRRFITTDPHGGSHRKFSLTLVYQPARKRAPFYLEARLASARSVWWSGADKSEGLSRLAQARESLA